MVYDSAWYPEGRPEAPWVRTRHHYYVAPCGPEQTRFHAFSFARFEAHPTWLHPVLRRLTARLTRNQILEDERFYPLIQDLPEAPRHWHPEPYDQPLLRIRARVAREYFGG
jgi:hypothetical protein